MQAHVVITTTAADAVIAVPLMCHYHTIAQVEADTFRTDIFNPPMLRLLSSKAQGYKDL